MARFVHDFSPFSLPSLIPLNPLIDTYHINRKQCSFNADMKHTARYPGVLLNQVRGSCNGVSYADADSSVSSRRISSDRKMPATRGPGIVLST